MAVAGRVSERVIAGELEVLDDRFGQPISASSLTAMRATSRNR